MALAVSVIPRPRTLARAARNFASAQLRRLGVKPIYQHWEIRAAVCERCPIRVVRCGVSYCGKPFLDQVERDTATEGCGCNCRDKAKSPDEHCPLGNSGDSAAHASNCPCKWCTAVRLAQNAAA